MSYFMKQKVGGKIFTSYWKIFVLNFSAKGNMAFFWAKKLMEKMIFTNYGKVLVLKFSVVGKTVVFESRSWWKDDIYWLQKSSCFEIFGGGKYGLFLEPRSWWKDDTYWLPRSSCFELSVMGNTIYFLAKNLMERWYLHGKMVFLSFLWYSRTWEICLCAQCLTWFSDLFTDLQIWY